MRKLLHLGDKKINGCGPWWIPVEWKDRYFLDECNLHDQDYSDGVKRRMADKAFYKRMQAKILTETNYNYYRRHLRLFQAWLFYHIVRNLGWTSHKK